MKFAFNHLQSPPSRAHYTYCGGVFFPVAQVLIFVFLSSALTFSNAIAEETDYEKARWDPIHFEPAIDKATNDQCLACHQEILENTVRKASPAGVKSAKALAWYQTMGTYEGPQETFHRRHLVTPLATRLMDMKCTTCHQGNDPREEAPIWPNSGNEKFTLRKMVDPNTCLMCHGQHNYEIMDMDGPWEKVGEDFDNDCLSCHDSIRTSRHKVNFLKAAEIEEAGTESSESCFGCHGGRAWYRIGYPYPRHPVARYGRGDTRMGPG